METKEIVSEFSWFLLFIFELSRSPRAFFKLNLAALAANLFKELGYWFCLVCFPGHSEQGVQLISGVDMREKTFLTLAYVVFSPLCFKDESQKSDFLLFCPFFSLP